MKKRLTVLRAAGKLLLCAAALGLGALTQYATRATPAHAAMAPESNVAELDSALDTRHTLAASASRMAMGERDPATPGAIPLASNDAAAKNAEKNAASANDAASKAGLSPGVPSQHDGMGHAFREGLVIHGATPHRLILFTFDDGPERRTTPKILDALDARGIKAVFFLTGARIKGENRRQRQQAAIAREIVRRGHIVGSHTIDHVQLPLLDDQGVLAQLLGNQAIFEDVFGERPWLFRPPGGARSPRVDEIVERHGYTQVLWNIGAGDFQVRSADDVVETWRRVLERREDEGSRGGIILLHDTYEWTVEAFPRIVDELEQRNCALLERGEELYDIVDDPTLFFSKKGDAAPGTEAAPVVLPPDVLARRQAKVRQATEARCRTLALR